MYLWYIILYAWHVLSSPVLPRQNGQSKCAPHWCRARSPKRTCPSKKPVGPNTTGVNHWEVEVENGCSRKVNYYWGGRFSLTRKHRWWFLSTQLKNMHKSQSESFPRIKRKIHEHEILSALAALYDAGSGDGSLAPNPRLAWQFQLLAKSSVPWSYGFFVHLKCHPPWKKKGSY